MNEITHNGKVYRRVGDDEVIKVNDGCCFHDDDTLISVEGSIGLTGKQAREKWPPLDFYTPKEAPMKYKSLKDITLNKIIESGALETCRDFQRFCVIATKAGYGWDDAIPLEKALEWKRTDFLLTHGFYGEEKEIQAGDMVRVFDGSWNLSIQDGILKQRDDYCIGKGEDGPMKVIAVCDAVLPADDCMNRGKFKYTNNVILKGKSGRIYFSNTQFCKLV